MMPATCVPCPNSSTARAARRVKSTLAATRLRMRGSCAMPESMTATPMPRPS